MRAISTATLLSIFALASSLTGVVQANGPRPQCTQTADITSGATCDSIATQAGLTTPDLQTMNPSTDCSSPLTVGGSLCVKMHKPGCAHHEIATDTTCNALASQYGITPKEFFDYNSSVKNEDCSGLTIGYHYCVATN